MKMAKACQCNTILNDGIPLQGNSTSSYEITVGGTVTNTGFGDLSNAVVTDKGLSFTLSVLPAGAKRAWGVGAGTGDFVPASTNPLCADGTHRYCFNSLMKSETNVANASATGGGATIKAVTVGDDGVPGDTTACSSSAPACTRTPGFVPSKCCSVTVTSSAQLEIDFDGRVTNNETLGLTSVSVQDAVIAGGVTGSYGSNLTLSQFKSDGTSKGTCTSCTLLPGDYVTFSGNYTPTSADLTTFQGLAAFRDRLKVTAVRPDTGATITNTDTTATCTITLGKACPAP
jgi:hypothetical protein